MIQMMKEERKKPIIRADLLWKGLLESFLYWALEIFYPELYGAVDLTKPPIPLNKELRVPGLHKANKEQKILDLLMDLPLKTGSLLRMLLHVEVQGAGTKAPFHLRMRDYACVITLTQKRPFAALAIRTTPKEHGEELYYEMNCFGTQHFFKYPTVFIDQMDEEWLLSMKKNPVALASLYLKRMQKAKKNEPQRYRHAKELLTLMKTAGYSVDTAVFLMQFIEGMTGLNAAKLKNELKKDLEDGINDLLGEVKDMTAVQTPILKKVLKKKAQEVFRAAGKVEGKLEDAQRMLSRGMPMDVIKDITQLAEEEVHSL
jgi:hypothetical protein